MAGLAAALAMHKQGLSVKIFERAKQLAEVGAGINVTPLGCAVLEELGLGPALADVDNGGGIQTGTLLYYTPQGVMIYNDPRGQKAGHKSPQYSMHRGKLQKVLLDAVRERIGSECIFTDHSFDGFSTEGAPEGCNVTARFKTYTGEALPPCHGKILLGCDGIRSAVRAQLYPGEEARFTGWRIYRTVVNLDASMLDGKTMLLKGDSKAAIAIYGIDERMRQEGKIMLNMGWAAHDSAFDNPKAPSSATNAKESWTAKVEKSEMSWIFEDWNFAEGVFSDPSITMNTIIEKAKDITCYGLYDRDPVAKWTFGPVTLLGDAAHPLLPFGSQGANQAFLDAGALGEAVSSEGTADLLRALEKYDEMRVGPASKVVMTNRLMGPTRLLKAMEEGCGGKSVAEQEQWVRDHTSEMQGYIEGYHALSGTQKKVGADGKPAGAADMIAAYVTGYVADLRAWCSPPAATGEPEAATAPAA